MAITRKNFMFIGSDRGGDRAAIFYTLIESAKLNGLDPEAYIAAVIDRMAKGHNSKALDALLPWNFRQKPNLPDQHISRRGCADAYVVVAKTNEPNSPAPDPKTGASGCAS